MKYSLDFKLNDGLSEAPAVAVEIDDLKELASRVPEELANDYGRPFGVGCTLTITRIA